MGTARGGGQSSKAKGRSAVAIVADLLRLTFHLGDGDVFVKATSQGGCDVHLSPLALDVFPFAIEVKNVEALNIWKALAQAQTNADGRTPIVFFKRARTQMYVALNAADFLFYVSQTQRLHERS